jgi:hypothetical protein
MSSLLCLTIFRYSMRNAMYTTNKTVVSLLTDKVSKPQCAGGSIHNEIGATRSL